MHILKDEQVRQQYVVEVNNIIDCLEYESTEQYYEKVMDEHKVCKSQDTVYCQRLKKVNSSPDSMS